VVLGSGDLNETLDQLDLLKRAGEQDREVLASVKETRSQLADSRGALLTLREEAADQESEARQRRQALERLLGERRVILEGARRALAGAQAAQAERLAAAQARQEQIIRDRAEPSSSGSTTNTANSPAPAASSPSEHLARIAQCESGGNPRAVSPNGLYRGKYQFHPDTWQSLGGTGDPAAASEAEQDRIAAVLYARQGAGPWPICGS
ncbi:MAG: transglycosylase family protein, partial [Thermoleophilia bacterium]|nr:transglycosylase family protein [Thermoleophilia bacterium]